MHQHAQSTPSCNGQCSTGTVRRRSRQHDHRPRDRLHVHGHHVLTGPRVPTGTSARAVTTVRAAAAAALRWCARRPISATTRAPAILNGVCSIHRPRSVSRATTGALCTQTDQCNGSAAASAATRWCVRRSTSATTPGPAVPERACARTRLSANGTSVQRRQPVHADRSVQRAGGCIGGNPVVCTRARPVSRRWDLQSGTGVCSNPPIGERSRAATTAASVRKPISATGPAAASAATRWCARRSTSVTTLGPAVLDRRVLESADRPAVTTCNDGSLCTQTDQCNGAGGCVGGNPVVCTPLDQCHDAGTCDTGTGLLLDPPSSNVTPCNDGDACSQTDTCDGAGACVGGNPVVCTPLDQCHDAGTCDTGTGVCSDPPSTNGTTCNDGNTCTIGDACTGGTCGGNSITCGDGIVQPGCSEDCDVPGGTDPNCKPDCHFVCGLTPQAGCRAPGPARQGHGHPQGQVTRQEGRAQLEVHQGRRDHARRLRRSADGDGLHALHLRFVGASAADPVRACARGRHVRHQPCWKTIKGGFEYNDKLFTPDGLQQVLLKSGAATKTKILVKGKGVDLPMPTLAADADGHGPAARASPASAGRRSTAPSRRTSQCSSGPKQTERRHTMIGRPLKEDRFMYTRPLPSLLLLRPADVRAFGGCDRSWCSPPIRTRSSERTPRTVSPVPTRRTSAYASRPRRRTRRCGAASCSSVSPASRSARPSTRRVAELSAGNNASNPTLTPRPASHHRVVVAERRQMEQRARPSTPSPTATALVGTGMGFKSVHRDAGRAGGGEPLRRRSRLDGQGPSRDRHQRDGQLRVARGRPSGAARQAAEAHGRLHATAVLDRRRLRRHQLLHRERAVRRRCVRGRSGQLRRRQSLHWTTSATAARAASTPTSATTGSPARPTPAIPTRSRAPTRRTTRSCNGECSTGTCLADPDDIVGDPVTGCLLTSTDPDGTPCDRRRRLHVERPMHGRYLRRCTGGVHGARSMPRRRHVHGGRVLGSGQAEWGVVQRRQPLHLT